jgi:hypothetical protein
LHGAEVEVLLEDVLCLFGRGALFLLVDGFFEVLEAFVSVFACLFFEVSKMFDGDRINVSGQFVLFDDKVEVFEHVGRGIGLVDSEGCIVFAVLWVGVEERFGNGGGVRLGDVCEQDRGELFEQSLELFVVELLRLDKHPERKDHVSDELFVLTAGVIYFAEEHNVGGDVITYDFNGLALGLRVFRDLEVKRLLDVNIAELHYIAFVV